MSHGSEKASASWNGRAMLTIVVGFQRGRYDTGVSSRQAEFSRRPQRRKASFACASFCEVELSHPELLGCFTPRPFFCSSPHFGIDIALGRVLPIYSEREV